MSKDIVIKKAGRPTKYYPGVEVKVKEYLKERQDKEKLKVKQIIEGGKEQTVYESDLIVDLPTVAGLASYIGVNKTTLYEWAKSYESFSNALSSILQEQERRLLNNGLSGKYNSTIAKLILSSNHGYAEKTEGTVEHSLKQANDLVIDV